MRFQDGSNMCYRQVAAEYQRMAQLGSEYDRKQVYQIRCSHCSASLTNRGMNVCLFLSCIAIRSHCSTVFD
ncbi:hypothetical protein LRAMOSA08289 [Lichtheimia ramosa]|uniref:Uncharacterized protein n=1 Tax=Lichtheimia ramosa TaxID=688394 RepID=A0A077WDL0_9FUNG|nr:hypothetical protein LRAMOSA08289 [Lichtheimia ramosa]